MSVLGVSVAIVVVVAGLVYLMAYLAQNIGLGNVRCGCGRTFVRRILVIGDADRAEIIADLTAVCPTCQSGVRDQSRDQSRDREGAVPPPNAPVCVFGPGGDFRTAWLPTPAPAFPQSPIKGGSFDHVA